MLIISLFSGGIAQRVIDRMIPAPASPPVTAGTAALETRAASANIFFQFSDDAMGSTPREIRNTNIASWYAFHTESVYVYASSSEEAARIERQEPAKAPNIAIPPHFVIFLLFEKPTNYRQMLAKCVGGRGMVCNVQISNDKYAVIDIIGYTPNATLDISTE